jgi:hypothetical protein
MFSLRGYLARLRGQMLTARLVFCGLLAQALLNLNREAKNER